MAENNLPTRNFAIQLDRLERRLKTLIESRIARLLPAGGTQENLTQRLVSAMREGIITGDQGPPIAPDNYVLQVNPQQTQSLSENQAMLDDLAGLIQNAGLEAGFSFLNPPKITISPNPDVPPQGIEIIAHVRQETLGETTAMAVEGVPNETGTPLNAFLIIDGTQIFPLDQPVINIGRSGVNQLVLDDPRVSREHAQLRASHGKYSIFDLESTGGTYVNRAQVSKSVLNPGDVISLAGVVLIYGQDETQTLDKTKELWISQGPTSPEHPTRDR
jgi:pSer/pThr/pTyr-binding forkhead associated (FHA) protein